MANKTAKTQVPIYDLLAKRWSGRAYDKTKPVKREDLVVLLEAARWAPSCFGDEPWRYLVWDRHRDPAGWQQAFDCLVEGNQIWVITAPILMLSTAGSEFSRNGKPNRWGQHDTGAASENLCLQAAALGLMAHQMGGFDADKIRRAFSIPNQFTCMAMIAIGYPTDADVLNDKKLKAQELAPRTRSPLSERFFEGRWDVGVETN